MKFRKQQIFVWLFSFLVGVFSASSHAGWLPASRQWATQLQNPPAQFKSGFKGTVWGVAQSYFFALNQPSYSMVPIPSPRFVTGKLDVALSLHQDARHQTIRSPLLVFLPGIFGNTQATSVLRAIENFSARGYHVVGIPNPWSPDYLNAESRVKPGHERYEARTLLHLIAEVKKVIGEEYIDETRSALIGESYGGFLATAALALDSDTDPVLQGTVTALGPPLHRDATIVALDAGYQRVQGANFGILQWEKHLFLLECVVGSAHAEFSHRGHACAESMLYQGFQKSLLRSAKIVHARHRMSGEVKKDLGFKEFFQVYAFEDQTSRKSNNPGSLLDWIAQMSDVKKKKLRFMTAEDDLVNENVPETHSWEKVFAQLHWTSEEDKQRLIVLQRGGHVGFVALPEFQQLLDIEYGERIKRHVSPASASIFAHEPF